MAVSLGAALLTTAAFASDVATDDQVTGSITTDLEPGKVPLLSYSSIINKDGSLDVILDQSKSEPDELSADVMTIYAPNVKAVERILLDQDWYLTMDADGAMLSIYTVPRDAALPSSVLRRLDTGHGIMKVDPASSFFKVFPSKYQIASQLKTFSEAAQSAVCAESKRPETLSASVNVKPGWSAAGRIKFNATWDVDELCKKSGDTVSNLAKN